MFFFETESKHLAHFYAAKKEIHGKAQATKSNLIFAKLKFVKMESYVGRYTCIGNKK